MSKSDCCRNSTLKNTPPNCARTHSMLDVRPYCTRNGLDIGPNVEQPHVVVVVVVVVVRARVRARTSVQPSVIDGEIV